jgi:TolB-like protein/Flp pilus assembly protein TadD
MAHPGSPLAGETGPYQFDDVVVDRRSYRVLKGGQVVPLGPRAFDLLWDLLDNAGRVVGKEELFERVWRGVAVTDNALTRAVKELRDAIGDDARAPRYVETIPRRGYRFVAPVRTGAPPSKIVLAVLPFADLSQEPEDYFCDGLTEELITQIAQIDTDHLGVIARTSAMAYKDTTKTISEVGRELGVAYVLEGSARREGDRVRVTAQLIDTGGQHHVWAQSYEEDLGDVLSLQRRVAEAVARAVRIELRPVPHRLRPRVLDPEAHEAYLKGLYLWNRRTGESILKALRAFEDSVRREPTFAPAHAGLGRCHMSFVLGLLPRASAMPRAEAALRRALELDEGLAEAHVTLGTLQAVDRDYAAAERSFRLAVTLNPSEPAAHHWYAMHVLIQTGRFEAALGELRRAQEQDPLSLIVKADVAAVYYLLREPDQALRQCERVFELNPDFARAHLYAGWAHSLNGAAEEAVTAFEKARSLDDGPLVAGWQGYGYGRAGRREAADRIGQELRRLAHEGRETAFFLALVQAGLGKTEEAVESLEQACGERSLGVGLSRYLPAFDGLREDRRFRRLAARVGQRG